jgi:small acid-soluble spore protein H (minor)
MDITRAWQIFQSPDTVEVKLNGVPVWIDQVDASTEHVKVHEEHNPAAYKTVPVTALKES